MMQWEFVGSSLGVRLKDREARLEHAERSSEDDYKTCRKITEDYWITRDDMVGSRRKFAMRFAEGIGKLAGNAKGDHRKEDRRTCRKIAGGCRNIQELDLN
ncbi:hypothetical protein B296_00007050 [Ensete ventricosum]|uniref:Uncharacterized protein n=1 Tax=Ensete ventricosum TaxID=4639 RepID=A0A426ZVU6_ENSVE|nr:hypothetical protein B296_00007050 [Ensete ventricosum]